MAMKVEYINPFIESGAEVIRMTTQMEVERGMPTLDNGKFETPEVSVVLGVVGDLGGQVIYGFSMSTALGIAGKMMGGVQVNELDEMSQSAVAELGNMMAGNAGVRFEKGNVNINISPPAVMTGGSVRITWPLHRALLVPLKTEVGDLIVWVCLEEDKKKG